jgi:hypothetical protein
MAPIPGVQYPQQQQWNHPDGVGWRISAESLTKARRRQKTDGEAHRQIHMFKYNHPATEYENTPHNMIPN